MDESMQDVLVCLINAITFEAEWKKDYREYNIKENRTFSNADGTESHVTMLSSKEDEYIENEYFIGFTKPYKYLYDFTYMALLPVKTGREFLQQAVWNTDLAELYSSRSERDVTVNLPEYSCEFEEDLKQTLGNMGVKELFTYNADLSNMSSTPLMMDAVIHKVKIKVNRYGTRAAAVTAGRMGATACPPSKERPKEVILDRPFVYAIIHNKTGIPLFVGTVNQFPDERKDSISSDVSAPRPDKARGILSTIYERLTRKNR